MGGTTTEGNVDWNQKMEEQLKKNGKKLWLIEQIEQLVFGYKELLFVSASLLFSRIGSWTECA